ncbi:MAG: MATE family efflux transporter [Clostridia bacterium]|nr:MATE family efflux transporter [Clostridia bacterium]
MSTAIKKTKKDMDMTQGPIFKNLAKLTLPLALASILQLLFNAADLIVIGWFSATPSISQTAVSSNTSLIHLIVNLAIGFSVGSNVVMSHCIGAKNVERAHKAVHTSIMLALISGVILMAVGFFGARFFLELMSSPAEVIDKADLYLKIYFIGLPGTIVYNFAAAILRSKGDSRRPTIYLAIGGVVNVVLNLILVLCGLDVVGVAVATAVSQYLSAALTVIALTREPDYCKLEIKKIRIHKDELLSIIRVGLPSGLLSCCFSLANVFIQSSINLLAVYYPGGEGLTMVNASSVASNVEGFIFTAIGTVSTATVSFAGQNYGAGNYARIKRVCLCGIGLMVTLCLTYGLVFFAFAEFFASLYNPDPVLIEYAALRVRTVTILYPVQGSAEILVACLRGMNRTTPPMFVSLFCICVFRIIWVNTIFPAYKTLISLLLCYPASYLLNFTITLIMFLVCYKLMLKKAKSPPPASEDNENTAPTEHNENTSPTEE